MVLNVFNFNLVGNYYDFFEIVMNYNFRYKFDKLDF